MVFGGELLAPECPDCVADLVGEDGNTAGDGGIDLVAVPMEQLTDLVEPSRGHLLELKRAWPRSAVSLSSSGHPRPLAVTSVNPDSHSQRWPRASP